MPKVAAKGGKKQDPWMLEELYFLEKNPHQKKKKRESPVNYSGKIGIHYNLTPNANARKS